MRFSVLILLWALPCVLSAEVDPKDRLIVETVQKIGSFRYETASAKIKEAIGRYLKANEGQPEFLDLVEKLGIPGQADGLLALAKSQADGTLGIKSISILIAQGEFEALSKLIHAAPPELGLKLIRSCGLASSQKLPAYLFDFAKNADLAMELRHAAIGAMAAKPDGQRELLARLKMPDFPPELRVAAGQVLHASSDPGIVAEAELLVPRPQSAEQQTLPPIADLAKKTGDAAAGKIAFDKVCIACHKVGDAGMDFGPGLSEIGSKLAKEALYTAILDPSAGISFGYEGLLLKLKDGSEALGFVASETEDELVLKVPGGIQMKLAKADLTSREKLKQSLMPASLQSTMSQVELVDLVEYLGSLKAKK